MKTLTTSLLLLLMVLVACKGTTKRPDAEIAKIELSNINAAMESPPPPPDIASIQLGSPGEALEISGEGNIGYGQGSGAGAPMNNEKGDAKTRAPQTDKKKIIKDGSLNIKTKDIVRAKKSFDALLKKLNAYYETEEFEKGSERLSYVLKIRVPSAGFEQLVSEVENGKDDVVAKSINARDVTEEYMDVQARLINKRDYLKKYKEILSRAFTVKDILEVQENIRVLQEEIESKEGRLKYLNDQVAYSTLDVTLFKEIAIVYKPQEPDSFKERVKSALSSGWMAIVDFVLWLITVWPQVLVALLVFFVCRRVYKKRKANK